MTCQLLKAFRATLLSTAGGSVARLVPVGALFLGLLAQPAFAQKPAAKKTDFDDLAKRATAARESSRIVEAAGLYKKALALRPRWEEGWWYLGTLNYEADRYPEALPAFRNLVMLDPKYGPAWALMGLCEFETKDYKNSFVHLQYGRARGLGDNQELVNVARFHEALLLNRRGEYEAAMELLSSLVARNVVSHDVKVAIGLALLRVNFLPSEVDPSKDALINAAGEAGMLMALSNFDQAEGAFKQMLKDFPGAPFLHYAYGDMLSRLSRYEDAESEFREEMKINPDSALPSMELAYIYLRIRRYQDALPPAQKAVQLAPLGFAGHYLLGRALLELGNIQESIRELETARRLGPFSPEIRYSLARAYAKARRPQEAEHERAEFARLNTLLERKKSQSGPQSYRTSSDRGELGPHVVNEPASPSPPGEH